MGTKVEGKTHRPGYFAMEDFSVNSNGNWLQYREEKKPNGHMYDRFTIVPANRSTEYDKEMLKRTMLIHEDTFRKQVNELHRLYKIQKDLMAQFQRADFNGHSRPVDKSQLRSFSSQAPSGDAKSIWQIEPCTSGHDNKHPSFYFMKESGFQCSSSGAPSRPSDNRFTKKILDLQLPADAYVDDDDVEILEAVGSSSRTNGSVLGGNVNLNHGDKQGLSSGDMSWISIDLRSQHGSIVSVASKPVERPSDTKITDFLALGAFTSQNQCYSSRGENLNFLGLAGNGKEKHITEASGSFGPNEQTRHNNLFSNKDDHNVSVAWIKHKPHGSDTSRGHYFGCPSTPHRPILASAASFSPVRSPWETSNTNKSYIEPSVAQNGLCNFFSVGSFDAPNPLLLLNIPGECHYPKHLQHDNCLMDVNLNSVPPHRVQDGTTIRNVEYGCDNSQVDISWLRKKPADLTKSDGHSQIVFRSTVSSEGTPTRILGFAISDAAEKGSQLLSIRHIDANCTPSAMHDAGPENQDQCKKVGTSVRNLIDLNDALPCMDDLEVHVRQQKDAIVSQEPSDPSNDSLAIAAAENLLAMSKDVLTVSPQPNTLHWFAKLAISNENTMIYCSTGDQDDEFEAMILQLEETKGYEYSPTPRASEENNKEKHNCAASLLLARPRRGQARRRRQKKDFQKDILLGLASLSRHEVSEDLQTLGRSMPVAPTRQGGSQPRGRRRPRNAAVTTEEVQVRPPPVPPALAATDLDVGRRGIMGWGRTTRRCHRTRCPPANNASVHLG